MSYDIRDRGPRQDGYSPSRMTLTFIVTDDNGEEQELVLPMKFEVCDTCQGRGTHVNPSIDRDGISAQEFAEDPDFAEAYMSGRYDQQCNTCSGEKVMPVIDRERADPAMVKRVDQHLEDEAAYRREVRREQELGY